MATFTFNAAGVIGRVEDATERGLASAAKMLSNFQKTGMTTTGRFTHSAPGFAPNVQRGGLRNSITSGQVGRMRWGAGSTFKKKGNYGLYLEKGAVIRPKRTKFLPVPCNPAAERLLEKLAGRGLRSSGQEFKFIPTRLGYGLLVGDRKLKVGVVAGKKGQRVMKNIGGEPVFKLSKRVVIKPRPWCLVAYTKNKGAIAAEFNRKAAETFAKLTKAVNK